MRWLLDQGLPRGAVALLVEAGQDAVHVGDLGMAAAPDSAILLRAVAEDRIIVTLDSDFHALLALSGSSRPSVLRIREEGLKSAALSLLILGVARQCASEMKAGCMLTYQNRKVRFRMLPLV